MALIRFIRHSFSIVFLIIKEAVRKNLPVMGCEDNEHIREFIKNKGSCNCTRSALFITLTNAADKSTHISDLLLTQTSFETKEQLLKNLPERKFPFSSISENGDCLDFKEWLKNENK